MITVRGHTIPDADLTWRFSRSSGPGGQLVNTTNTRVQLSFDLAGSDALPDELKRRMLGRLGDQVVVVASEHASQQRNRRAAEERLAEVLEEAMRPPPPPADPDQAAGYVRWIAENPAGYVLNTQRGLGAAGARVHTADCRHVARAIAASASSGRRLTVAYLQPASHRRMHDLRGSDAPPACRVAVSSPSSRASSSGGEPPRPEHPTPKLPSPHSRSAAAARGQDAFPVPGHG